jgi:hypothetical protein
MNKIEFPLVISELPDANVREFVEAFTEFLHRLNKNLVPTPVSITLPRGLYSRIRQETEAIDGKKPKDNRLWFMHATSRVLLVEGGGG